MNKDTYQTKDTKNKLETIEWDDIWFEHTASDPEMRIAYIGDSISRGTRRNITTLSETKILCDNYATSKALDNPYFTAQISLFAKQQKRCDALLFNNGLHGWHLDDEKEYPELLEKMLVFLKKEFSAARIILVLTTFITDEKRNQRVQKRNSAAIRICEKLGIEFLDLYTLTKDNARLLIADGVHFTPEGYEKIALAQIEKLREKK